MPFSSQKLGIFFTALVTISFLIAIAIDATPALRGLGPLPQWQWLYRHPQLDARVLLPLAVVAVIALSAHRWLHRSPQYIQTHERWLLLRVVLLSVIFQLSVLFASNGIMVLLQRTIHPTIIGYFSAATSVEQLPEFLRNYSAHVSELPNLAKYHPPGPILFYWAVNQSASGITRFLPLPATLQPSHTDVRLLWNNLAPNEKLGALIASFAVILLAALASVSMYYLGKALYNPRAGLIAALIYAVVPSVVLFTPHIDVITPLFTSLSLLCFVIALKRRTFVACFLSGVFMFLGAFTTLTVLATGLIYALLGISALVRDSRFRRDLHWYVLSFVGGLAVLPVILYAASGFNVLATVQEILGGHTGFVQARRSQPLWLIYNYYDFFLFLGIPLLLVALAQLRRIVVSLRAQATQLDVVLIGFWLLTLLIDVSGIMHGETGRTWMAFIPFIVAPLAAFLNRADSNGGFVVVLVALQGLQAITLALFLITM